MKISPLWPCLALPFFVYATASGAAPVAIDNGVIRDAAGRTLYVFSQDKPGKSNCNDACTATWKPFKTGKETRAALPLTVLVRDDGTGQWAYRGQPLYYFAGDKQTGDIQGDGLGGIWRAARAPLPPPTNPHKAKFSEKYMY